MDELCLSCHLAVPENAFECGTCRKWVHYSCTQLPTYMIYQLAVILTDTDYKCESCVLSPGQEVSNKFMEIDRAISAQKTLGNGGILNDSTSTDNPVINADVENPNTTLPPETDVTQQASNLNPDLHRAALIIQQQQQNVPQQTNIAQPEEPLQHGLVNGNAGGAPPSDASRNPQDADPTQPPRSTTCKFYAQGTCKHGRRGLSCQFNHPRMCKSFIKSGVRGCNRGLSCNFFHPRLCPQSLHHNQCIRKRCFLYHVTGSERPNYIPLNSDQYNPNSRPQNPGLPAPLQRNSNPKSSPRPIQYCPNDSDYVRSHDLYAEHGPNPRSDIGNREHYNPNHFPNPRLDSSSRDRNISDSFVHSFLGQMKELQSQVLGLQRQQQIMFQSFATTKYAAPSPPAQTQLSQPFHNPQWAPQQVHHN